MVVPWCTPYLDNTCWDVSRELLMSWLFLASLVLGSIPRLREERVTFSLHLNWHNPKLIVKQSFQPRSLNSAENQTAQAQMQRPHRYLKSPEVTDLSWKVSRHSWQVAWCFHTPPEPRLREAQHQDNQVLQTCHLPGPAVKFCWGWGEEEERNLWAYSSSETLPDYFLSSSVQRAESVSTFSLSYRAPSPGAWSQL